MTETSDDMYWVSCPQCSSKMLRIKSGEIEIICSNTHCKRKWLITVSEDTFEYKVLKE